MLPIACLLAATAACAAGEPAPPLPRDLLREIAAARVQPAPTPEVARSDTVTIDGVVTPALVLTSPARVTWAVRFPERADLEATVALVPNAARASPAGVAVRIGLSDDRTYDELLRVPLEGGSWRALRVDLSAYSGWTWSLFYRPSRMTWRLIVAADPTPGGSVAIRALTVRRH